MEVNDTRSGAGDFPNPAEPGSELEAAAKAQEKQIDAIELAAQAPAPVMVFTADTQDEVEIVRGILDTEGVPAIVVDRSSPALGDALRFGGRQTAGILVAPEDAERAKALIESYQTATVTDDMVGEPDASLNEE